MAATATVIQVVARELDRCRLSQLARVRTVRTAATTMRRGRDQNDAANQSCAQVVAVGICDVAIHFFIFFLVARGLVAIVAISVYAYHAVTVPPPWSIDGCVDTILDARVDQGLPSAHIPRPALSGSVQVERDGAYIILLGPHGCGKTIIGREAQWNKSGVLWHSILARDLSHTSLHEVILGQRCRPYMDNVKQSTESHFKDILLRAAANGKLVHNVPGWVPS
jgi:hypothetical protein